MKMSATTFWISTFLIVAVIWGSTRYDWNKTEYGNQMHVAWDNGTFTIPFTADCNSILVNMVILSWNIARSTSKRGPVRAVRDDWESSFCLLYDGGLSGKRRILQAETACYVMNPFSAFPWLSWTSRLSPYKLGDSHGTAKKGSWSHWVMSVGIPSYIKSLKQF